MWVEALLNRTLWIGIVVFLSVFLISITIFYILLFRMTHVKIELQAFFTKTPLAIYFQDNKFVEWKLASPINGIVYENKYGPFIVTTTYVDNRTKSVIIPFDVDMDGDRSANLHDIVKEFKNVSNNEKSISQLRSDISNRNIVDPNNNIKNLTSFINFGSLKTLFFSTGPHNIRSKIEKIVAERTVKMSNVNHIHAIVTFGAIFGIIVLSVLLLNIVGKK